jgi:hypothetical protein
MQAKTKIEFSGTIGSNDPKVTQDQLADLLFDLEVEFNEKHPNLRMHIFADFAGIKKETK